MQSDLVVEPIQCEIASPIAKNIEPLPSVQCSVQVPVPAPLMDTATSKRLGAVCDVGLIASGRERPQVALLSLFIIHVVPLYIHYTLPFIY